ncbi:protein Snq2p [[Candida] railenensis]|uniref:Protein Snq2p n=1 Tax=[Candida] railenensis TaxID=45579 RepID=A0A9P0VXP1_9ASCO|nr:protein Snq2p [[Candida] railenensis]
MNVISPIDSSSGSINDFVGKDGDLNEENRLQLVRTITSLHNEDVLQRLSTLSRELSKRNPEFNINPEDFDLQNILSLFTSLAHKQGIHLRQSGITFSNVEVKGVDESFSVAVTALDMLKGPVGAIQAARAKKRTPDRIILKDISGYAKPGEMVLVLGRPGAGCSSLLKTLGGTDIDLFKSVSGDIRYDGLTQAEMLKNFKSDIIYNPELDEHMPHLTVEQTLNFAIGCKTPEMRINGISREEFIGAMKEILATVFGLRHTYHTKVGNDYVRGVSGGERKRVSIAEALACRASVYCWDNATRGLDSSTALEYARAIRTSTNLLKTTAFVTIYQAGENIYETFDKVTVLYRGHQVYFGPMEEAKSYFEEMGWECPARQSTAEFLTAITDPIGRFPKPGFEDRVPRTAEEFEAYWLNSPAYARLQEEIAEYNANVNQDETRDTYYTSIKQEKMKYSRMNSKYTINYFEQLKLCTVRRFQGIWGDKAYTITQLIAALSQGLIAGSLYYNTPTTVTGSFSRGGVVFFAALYVSLMSLAEVTAAFSTRSILMKQKNYSMYHPSADALAYSVTTIPVSFLVTVVFVIVLYFLSNLSREAGKFFTFLLFTFMVSNTISALFKAVASLNKTIAGANMIAGILVLAILMYSSFMIQRPSMHPWFKWISYINPLLYGFESMIATEFHGRHMECDGQYLTPNGPGYQNLSSGEQVCSFSGSVAGQSWVLGDDYLKVAFTYSFSHVWRNFGILLGFYFFFTIINAIGCEIIKPVVGGGDKLIYLKGKIPDSVLLPEEKSGTDTPTSLEKEKKESAVFEDLKSKDLFAWRNVNYVIPYDGKERTLLDDISGYCVPGTLTALMGESGAGKTTLLNTLAQRISMGVVTGDMLVNGNQLDASFSRRTGYVQQQDVHISQVTVRESLRFAARLRRSNDVSDEEKLDYVEKIISVLDMDEYADAIVGNPGEGLNVEQRKKLSIGVELVAKPSLLLFLDEPTSGLDSQSAWAIVKLLRDLANAGQSILCTIHQPSATLFEEFDRLLLLKKGGKTVYFGDIGKRSHTLLEYFERNGARPCDDSENPAEYILEAIGAGATASVKEDWHDIWVASPEKKESDLRGDKLISEYLANNENQTHTDAERKQLAEKYATPFTYQFMIVLRRNALTFFRNPEYLGAKIGLYTLSGLFIGFTFFGIKHSIIGMQNGQFTAFLSVVVAAPLINQAQAQAITGRNLYEVREKMSNTYHWSLMILSQFINEIPYCIIGSAIQFVSIYFPTQANTSGPHAGVFYLTLGVFFQFYYISFGLMMLYCAPDVESAAILVSFFYTFIVAFSGVVQPTTLMPGFWTFMHKVSPYTYFIENLVTSILHGREVKCSKTEYSYFNPPSGQTCIEFAGAYLNTTNGYLSNPDATSDCGYCSYSQTDAYMATTGMKYSHRWRNLGFYCVYVIFDVAAMLFLYWVFRYRQGSLIPNLSFLKRKKK